MTDTDVETWRVGRRVRHRLDDVAGVILETSAGELKVSFPDGVTYVAESDLDLLDAEPQELLSQGHLGDSNAALLRLIALLVDNSYRFDPGSTLSNARLEPKLHQAFVAHRVTAEKVAPRMILADEVGLGKTIEAGLIIKELKARQSIDRTLIICPASLTRQWQSELRGKFNETFEILDGSAAKHFGRGGANPFTKLDNIICSLPFASQAKRADQIVEAGWDMVVFDEAHRVRRTTVGAKSRVTLAYKLAEELKDNVHGMLLLSATPVQLHAYELFSLIELVEPGLFRSFEQFERERRRIPALNELMRVLDKWPALTEAERALAKLKYKTLFADLSSDSLPDPIDTVGRNVMRDRLVALHPLAASMVRNRKSELGMGGQRKAVVIQIDQTDEERELYNDITDYIRYTYSMASSSKNNAVGFLMVVYQKMLTSSANALRVSFRRRIAKLQNHQRAIGQSGAAPDLLEADDPAELSSFADSLDGAAALQAANLEFEIARLTELAGRLDRVRDSKVARAILLVDQVVTQGKKAVIFTQFIETQSFLAAALEHNGFDVATFNGTLSADEKENAVRRFREKAQVLVSTEAGGEGRNLQFASVLVNFDLPWNPMKVEQRIGRLDRIGQTKPVEIYNLVYTDTLEERIVEVLHERIRLFEESVGSLDPILGQVEKDIERMAMDESVDVRADVFEVYGADLERRVREARLLEETLADFVLDRASFRRDETNALLGGAGLAKPGDLEVFTRMALDYFGGSVTDHSEGGSVINLSTRLTSRLKVKGQSHRGVFDPAAATRLDDLDFFACGHELIDRIRRSAEHLENGAVGARQSTDAPEGTWVEVIYRVRAELIAGEATLLRHLVGPDLVVTSRPISTLPLHDVPIRLEVPAWVAAAVSASESRFRDERATTRTDFETRFEAVRESRLVRLNRVFDSQRERLEVQIRQGEEWLADRDNDAISDKDRRVLPARRGLLERDLTRLARVEQERISKIDELEQTRVDIRAEVLSAALVIGSST